MKTAEQKVIDVLKSNGGVARTRDFLTGGVHPRDLYKMRDAGQIVCIARGLYQIPGQPPDAPDIATICKKIPNGVLCLISALSLHQITTEIPRAVHIALKRGAAKPQLNYPPVATYWMSEAAFEAGVERMNIEGLDVPVYCAEKTLADCFKYRNKIGMDTVLEALRLYRERFRFDGNKLMHYAKICRVDNIMRPYLEASL
ncbi:MAG: type IV toxin-antitoxin system AbiEi family antitoxin domain-containing protein [Kiritimatiellales bacterium]